ncbi:MAG TPA: prepilin-type N-terminal cleavage/methylation domain-containing protein [Fimbriimonadaceae bacterium]|nr:prepilin-type N-terminal cleavage/methylation domain-containing protein [Fimbriimonadaceae bacterium]
MRRAFTLIELLVVIAIIAILAAILFPVFAQAKSAAKVTSSLSGIKQVGMSLHMYSTDADDTCVYEYGSAPYTSTDTWVGKVMPYVKNRSIFWDKTKREPNRDVLFDPYYNDNYRWEWATNFSLNVDGYSRAFSGSCAAVNWSSSTQRTLTGIENIAERAAVMPTQYGRLDYGWHRFYARDASWPYIDEYIDGWSWENVVWDARKTYPASKLIVAFADGHAGKAGREKFIGYSRLDSRNTEAANITQYCNLFNSRGLDRFWGRSWAND